MTTEIPVSKPERERKAVNDNARKFKVSSIDTRFLEEKGAKSFELTVDWLDTEKDSETKLVRKDRGNGIIEILFITKVTDENGKRKTVREEISAEKYKELLCSTDSSNPHLKKRRYEFDYIQNDTAFSLKYDEFADSELRILEVDASSEEDRDSFVTEDFPVQLTEVTDDRQYEGYRVAKLIHPSAS